MLQAVIYARVSTEEQATEGVSLDVQQGRAIEWARANGCTVDPQHVFVDAGLSGKAADNRPALQLALRTVCASKGVLIVYSMSRLARSTKDAITIAERLQKAGAHIVSLSEHVDTTSASGKFMFSVLAARDQMERDLIAERTRAALAHKKSRGERVGQIPFGFDVATDGVRLVPNDSEQRVLAEVASMRGAGTSWREVAEALNARGIRTKTGTTWSLHNARKVAHATA